MWACRVLTGAARVEVAQVEGEVGQVGACRHGERSGWGWEGVALEQVEGEVGQVGACSWGWGPHARRRRLQKGRLRMARGVGHGEGEVCQVGAC